MPSIFLFPRQHSRHQHGPPASKLSFILQPKSHPSGIRVLNNFVKNHFDYKVLVVSGVNLITFNTGYGIGLTSPMLGQLTGLYLDEDNFSWFASSLVIGQIIGSLIGSTIANRLGRKKTCMMAAIFSSCGWAMLAASQNFWMLILARITTGLFDCLAIPGGYMYISEVSETKLKGSFLNSNAIASGLGIAFGYLFGSNFLWRYTCFVALLVNASGIMTFLLCQESPVFLLMKNQVNIEHKSSHHRTFCF